jgi:bifunctional UDP-N-acetylglucosamine pyrophosphorylase/glucosamine-1-phosphate N-acetyltransferase
MSDHKSNNISAVILAGEIEGKFQSETSFLLHPLAGQPIIMYTLNAAQEAVGDAPILAIDKNLEQINQLTGGSIKHVIHQEQRSDVQILRQIEEFLAGSCDTILMIRADMPLLTSTSLEQLISAHLADASTPFSMLTFLNESIDGYHHVIRDKNGAIASVSNPSPAFSKKQATYEHEAGVYCLTVDWLRQVLPRLPNSPASEFRLTDLIPIATTDNLPVQGVQLADSAEALRIDTRVHLAEAEGVMRQRILQELMLAGVTIIDPNATYIEAQVEIGADTVIHPNTYLYGTTQIGSGCKIGPNSLVKDTSVGNHCEITFSVAEEAVLEDDVDIGPFAHLRKGAHLAQGVHMGNYGEVKNSYLGPGTKMGHFSYVGDANIGPGVNIGAGVITANYDGKNKYATEIGAGAFIGSDSMLVAPLKIGAGARTGAGSVVTKDVPPNSLAVGIPARVIRKEEEKDGS